MGTAVKQFDVAASPPDADATTKGIVKLAGDLGGSAASPTVPGLAGKQATLTATGDVPGLTSALAGKVGISDSRLTDTRTPTDATVTDAKIATTLSPSKITGTAVVTADSRLSDARTPLSHTHAESEVTNLVADLAAKAPNVQKFKTGRYYGPVGTLTTTNTAEGQMNAMPFIVGSTTTFDRIGINVTSGGGTGAVCRLGIYNDDGTGTPGTLVLDAGTVVGTSIASVEATISQALSPGLYWLVTVTQGAAATRPSYSAHTGGQATGWPVLGALTLATAFTAASGGYATASAAAAGALPTPFPAIASSGGVPRVVLRAV